MAYLKSVDNSVVIPGKLAIASATRNPGILKLLDTAFAGMTVGCPGIDFANYGSRDVAKAT